MAEVFALVSTTVSIAFQVKTIIEQIKYNREAHRLLVNRITSSLRQLKAESRKITKSSPELIIVVNKLKTILDKCLESTSSTSGLRVKLKEWFLKDSIASALQEVETQISYCFQEFGALGTIRIERKLGDHSVQINRKLDELLRRTQVRNSINNGTVVDRDLAKAPIAIPLQVRTTSDSSSNSSINALNVPGVALKSFSKTGITPSRMISRSKELSIQTFALGRPRFMGFLSSLKSENSVTSMSANSRYEYQANELDSECKRLRSHQHLSEALIPGRKAVALRRITYATDKSVTTTAALARSLTYLTRCLKDIHVDSHLAGTQVSAELTAVLSESIALYKLAFKEDKACRVDLATALYNLSVLQSEPPKPKFSGNSSLNPNVILNNTIQRSRNLTSALAAAEEAVHHFTILEREDPDAFGMDLANALVNLSFILSDNGSHEEALSISRKAVMLAYRFNSTDPHTHERVNDLFRNGKSQSSKEYIGTKKVNSTYPLCQAPR
ncbi:tetratricopeptide repeat family [Lentinula edodes]|uniref:Tetratricopeptide repeat family n=1 Tax=Lentinula edodes TaxID=5353 RepID=A0A1Q3DVL3_LENED|nr:tetratricopeptide repeat family [Lentinula edodes]